MKSSAVYKTLCQTCKEKKTKENDENRENVKRKVGENEKKILHTLEKPHY